MKKLLVSIISVLFLLAIVSCSDEENPKFRIRNERTTKANVQVQTTGGNTININDVEEAETTAYQSAAEGNIVATAVIQNETVSPTITFFAAKDIRYTIVIRTGTIPSLRVDLD
ncbi:MAG: hypothetical protein KKF62_03845 [Bacteroidetes bacterium]|nr:hypothetical protein [Bacteroidota bacterium]MBU1117152.1 hypothetical protein [Bacteroidota bacterium]MBU1798576.1 hypothetical protein [Bacteroidota bacterium]